METTDDFKNILERVEKKESIAKKRLLYYTILPVLAAIILLYYFTSRITSSKNELDTLKQTILLFEDSLQKKNMESNALKYHIDSLNNIYTTLDFGASKDFGWLAEDVLSKDSFKIKQSKEAHSEILKLIKNNQVNVNITIRYYTKRTDKGKVDQTLRKCGYREIIVDKDFYKSKDPTNAIYFSENISTENIKLIAYALLRAGIDIKIIKKYPKKIAQKKPNSIEIANDKKFNYAKSISLEEIKKTESFR